MIFYWNITLDKSDNKRTNEQNKNSIHTRIAQFKYIFKNDTRFDIPEMISILRHDL